MLINRFPPLPAHGAEQQAERLAMQLAKLHLRISVLTRKVGNIKAAENRDGFDIVRIPQIGPGLMKTITFSIGAILTILRRRRSFDILHAHLPNSPAVAAAVAGRLLGKKVIVKFGATGLSWEVPVSEVPWRQRLVLAVLRRWADVYVVLSSEMEKVMLEAGFSRSRIVRMVNGVDTEQFSPAVNNQVEELRRKFAHKTIVLFTGRLVPIKALDVLLRAFSSALKTLPDLHLLLVGEGEERSRLEAMAAELDIQHNMTFVGQVKDVKPYLRAANMFVLPSWSEGMSNSLLEAMSTGLPCIATRISSSVDVLEDGAFGILVEPGDVAQLADAVLRLASNPRDAIELGLKARQHIVKKYDFSSVALQYHSLYQSLYNGG